MHASIVGNTVGRNEVLRPPPKLPPDALQVLATPLARNAPKLPSAKVAGAFPCVPTGAGFRCTPAHSKSTWQGSLRRGCLALPLLPTEFAERWLSCLLNSAHSGSDEPTMRRETAQSRKTMRPPIRAGSTRLTPLRCLNIQSRISSANPRNCIALKHESHARSRDELAAGEANDFSVF